MATPTLTWNQELSSEGFHENANKQAFLLHAAARRCRNTRERADRDSTRAYGDTIRADGNSARADGDSARADGNSLWADCFAYAANRDPRCADRNTDTTNNATGKHDTLRSHDER